MEIRDYLRIIQSRWYIVLAATILLPAIGLFMKTKAPVVYTSSVELLMRKPQEFYLNMPETTISQTFYSEASRPMFLRSPEVLRRVILENKDIFGVEPPPAGKRSTPELDQQIYALKSEIKVESSKEDGTIRISYSSSNPETPQRVLQSLVNAFSDESKNLQKAAFGTALDYLEKIRTDRLKEIEKSIGDKEKEKTDIGIISIPEVSTRSKQIENKIEAVRKERLEIDKKFLDADIKRSQIKAIIESAQIRKTGTEVSIRSSADDLDRMLFAKYDDLEKLRTKFRDSAKEVRKVMQEIEELQNRIQKVKEEKRIQEITFAKEQMLEEYVGYSIELEQLTAAGQKLDSDIAALESQRAEVKMTDEEKRLLALYDRKMQLEGQLKLLYESKLRVSDSIDSKKLELGTAQELVTSPVASQSGPFNPQLVAMPSGQTNSFLLAIAGLIAGITAAYLSDYMSRTIRSEVDIKRYANLPLLGLVLKIKKPEERIITTASPKANLLEVFSSIGILLMSKAKQTNMKVFMVGSSKAEEGKSTIACDLAISLAKMGEKVVLVDCDLRKAAVHKLLMVDNKPGLSDYLVSKSGLIDERVSKIDDITIETILRPSPVSGLYVISGGSHPKNPVPLLRCSTYTDLLSYLRANFNYVIVDVPPVNVAVDSLVVGKLCDSSLLVIAANETEKEELTTAKRVLEQAGTNVLGCILNKAGLAARGYYYYYYYYYYDKYRYKYYRE